MKKQRPLSPIPSAPSVLVNVPAETSFRCPWPCFHPHPPDVAPVNRLSQLLPDSLCLCITSILEISLWQLCKGWMDWSQARAGNLVRRLLR